MSQPIFKRIDTVFLPVRNLETAVDWYKRQLGLSLRWNVGGYACLDLGETPLTLVERGADFAPATQAPFNFFAPDIDQAYAHLKAAGVTLDPEIANPPGLRLFGFADLDGNRLEVCWWPVEQSTK